MTDRPLNLPEGVPPLSSYYAYITGGCNLACRHCWITPTFQRGDDPGEYLSYDLFALAIQEGLPLGLNHVKLTGGEPLLHPELTRLIDLIRENELSLSIETNGTLLSRSLAAYLREKSTLSVISVSLDGANSDTHDAFRSVRGSFEKACQGIRNLVEVGFRPQVIMSLHKQNVDEIELLVQLAQSLGASSVKFNIIQPSGRGEKMVEREQTLSIPRLIELGRWIENDVQKRTSIKLYYSWPMAFYGINHLLSYDGYSCSIVNILGILHSGQLALCGIGTEVPELCYGRLGKDNLADIWRSNPTLLDLRKQIPSGLEGICSECIFRDRCLGMCVAENYHNAKRLTAPFWFCHSAYEMNLFPVSRRNAKIYSVYNQAEAINNN